MEEPRLTARLRKLAERVPAGARLADIGTDHAGLPVWLLLRGQIRAAIATDVHEGPLARARAAAARFGVPVDCRLCDGLDGVSPEEADTIVLAGLGGETMIAILARAPWTRDGAHTLLLQPMTKAAPLRRWLSENGYAIRAETLVRDRGILYVILTVGAGASAPLSPARAYCGAPARGEALYGAYVDERLRRLRRAAEGLARSSLPDKAARIAALEAVMEELRAMREEWEHDDGT